MKRLRLLFYFTSVGIAIGYFFAFLLFFFTQFEMLADQSLVIFVWTVYGIMTGLYFKRINRKYTFFIIEGIILLMAIFSGKTKTLLYITKAFNKTLAIFILLIAILTGIIAYNFNSFWIKFHTILFSNDLWLLSPDESNLIKMVPEEFFISLITRIIIHIFIVFFLLLITNIVLKRKIVSK